MNWLQQPQLQLPPQQQLQPLSLLRLPENIFSSDQDLKKSLQI